MTVMVCDEISKSALRSRMPNSVESYETARLITHRYKHAADILEDLVWPLVGKLDAHSRQRPLWTQEWRAQQQDQITGSRHCSG